jgi:hypothetical protein
MKTAIATLLLAFVALVSNAQTSRDTTRTVQANKDTVRKIVTTVITTKYDTLKYKPVVPPKPPGYKRPKYKASGAITLSNISNQTISLDSINSNGGFISQLVINNGVNIHVTKMYFTNTIGKAVILNNCTNIIVDSCMFYKVAFGVDAYNCKQIQVINNQGLDLYDVGKMGSQFAHWVQFRSVTGGGNKINYNKFECTNNSLNAHDLLNVLTSKGLKNDSIQVIGNWLRGGQVKVNASPVEKATNGAAGIVAGEIGSQYVACRYNILVNPGYVGIQPQAATDVSIDHNTIYSKTTPASLVGLSMFNYSSSVAASIYMGNNKVKWYKYTGSEYDFYVPGSKPSGMGTNIYGGNLDESILPATIITWK